MKLNTAVTKVSSRLLLTLKVPMQQKNRIDGNSIAYGISLKGWIELVFSLGFAFGMTADAWRGDVGGRIPLLDHEKALIIQTTIWNEESYEAGLKPAMKVLIDEYALRYPDIKRVDHGYFDAVPGADDATRRAYFDRAYQLGREF